MPETDAAVRHARLEVDLAVDVADALAAVMAYRSWDAATATAAAISLLNKAMTAEVLDGVPGPRGPVRP